MDKLTELKAKAYDLIAAKEQIERELAKTNQEIYNLTVEAQKKEVKK